MNAQEQYERQARYDLIHHRMRVKHFEGRGRLSSEERNLYQQNLEVLREPALGYNSVSLYNEQYLKELDAFEAAEGGLPVAMSCQHLVEIEPVRGVNALRVESPVVYPERCGLKKPAHWPEIVTAFRWLASGGEGTVFEPCFGRAHRNCPLRQAEAQA